MRHLAILALGAAMTFVAPASASTFVAAINSGTTDLGFFAAGDWLISASGVVELSGAVGQLSLGPDGVPPTPLAPPYDYFNGSGATTTVNPADGGVGAGGSSINLGSFMGSFIAVAPLGNFPPPQANYFAIGFARTVHLASAGHIYGQVNDTFYSNNSGGFVVDVTRVVVQPGPAIPEPATWAIMLAGFLGIGAALRRRRPLTA